MSSGLGRYVYAWLMPSVVISGIFFLVLLPTWRQGQIDLGFGAILESASFLLTSLTLSAVLAYCARGIYQFLEGYTMPKWLTKRLRRRMQRQFLRLTAIALTGAPLECAIAEDKLKNFPSSVELVLPTRLGNSLRAMEYYGTSRFGLDSQSLWYELQSVANPELKKDVDETQGATDFFISALTHLLLLSIASLASFVAHREWYLLIIALLSGLGVYPAYRQAAANVAEWRWTVQALVNTTRPALAAALSLRLPRSQAEEVLMWKSVTALVQNGPSRSVLTTLDRYRKSR